jgi:type IV fimbrial biogenesis protein FimT
MYSPPTSRTQELGFTIVELMAVIAIATILVAIGVPSYRSVTSSSRMSTEVNSLLGDLQFARSEALKEGRTVTTCISSDGATCTGGALWHSGWIVFSDPNNNATVDGAGDTVLRVQRGFSGGDTFQEPSGLTAVTFNRAGFALNLPNAGVLLTLHDRVSNPVYTRCLSIAMAGMAATQTNITAPGTCT